MYFSVFPSSEYYSNDSNEDINDKLTNNEEDLCLICWLPSQENNEIKYLSQFIHIKQKCNCKPKLHLICINDWIKNSQSCPICRKKMNIVILTANTSNLKFSCYIICISYTVYFLRFLFYISSFNLLCLLIYKIYLIFLMANNIYIYNYEII